jgi:hypothetical protein
VLKARMRKREGADLVHAYERIEGTTTPSRRHWQRGVQLARGGGWYHATPGRLADLRPDQAGLTGRIHGPDGTRPIHADYVIDCTGLSSDVTEHRVLRDLLEHGGARRNPLGRLDVERSFELRGAASGPGLLYVTGAASYGGYFPGVDTFLGLQISAQEVTDDIARRGHCRRMGPARSVLEWLRWTRGRHI